MTAWRIEDFLRAWFGVWPFGYITIPVIYCKPTLAIGGQPCLCLHVFTALSSVCISSVPSIILPHIHAIYGDDTAAFDIRTGEILDGHLPSRAAALVREWMSLHAEELLRMGRPRSSKDRPLE